MVRDLAVLGSVGRVRVERVMGRVPGGGVQRVVLLRSGGGAGTGRGGLRAGRPGDRVG